jgi:ribosomal protein S18 acetylase RimI-like enzyme
MATSTAEISIRRAEPKEAEEISACLRGAFEAFRTAYTAGAFEDTVPSPAAVAAHFHTMQVFVACAGSNEVQGTIACSVNGNEGHLRGMAVRPALQGQAVASRLLAAAETAVRDRGCTRVTLDTTAALPRAIRFYEKHGFARSGKVADYYGMPLYEFAKSLRDTE